MLNGLNSCLHTIVLLLNLEFSLKYLSLYIMNGCYMWFMWSEDLRNLNPRHEFIYVYVECCCLWCWWYWDEMMMLLLMIMKWDDVDVDDDIEMKWLLMRVMTLRWDDINVDYDIEMRWCWCWWWHCDEMMLVLTMSLRWMHVMYVHRWCSDLSKYPWRGKGILFKNYKCP